MTDYTFSPDTVVRVRRQWDDWAMASYRLADVTGFHWSVISGGRQVRSRRRYVHAYVWCDAAIEGDVSHSCLHGPPPHRIKVCLVAGDNGGSGARLMRHVRAIADEWVRKHNERHWASLGRTYRTSGGDR